MVRIEKRVFAIRRSRYRGESRYRSLRQRPEWELWDGDVACSDCVDCVDNGLLVFGETAVLCQMNLAIRSGMATLTFLEWNESGRMDVAKRNSPMRKRRVKETDSDSRPENGVADESSALVVSVHRIEEEVQRELLGQAELRFSSLVVRRVPGGVCLEGVLEADDVDAASSSVCGLARRVAGVQDVLNHLVVRHSNKNVPVKG